jgi:hypothetical protein
LNRLDKSILKDELILRKFDYVTINDHKGVLLDINEYQTIYGKDCKILPLSDQNSRYGEIYQNAHNKVTWGAHLETYNSNRNQEIYLGNNWEDYNELLEVVKDWVAIGKIPKGYK